MTPLIAAVVTFSIQSSAFFAEIFRGGILSIYTIITLVVVMVGQQMMNLADPAAVLRGLRRGPACGGQNRRARRNESIRATRATGN